MASAFGIKLPGTTGTKGPLGTASDPIYVSMRSAEAAARSVTPSGRAIPSVFGPSTSGPYPREAGTGLLLRGAALGAPALPLAPSSQGAVTNLSSMVSSVSSAAADGSPASPIYSIIADSSGNPFGSENPLPLTPASQGALTNLSQAAASAANAGAGASGASGGSGFSSMISSLGSMLEKTFSSLTSALSGIVGGLGSMIGGIGGGVASGFTSFLGIFGLARGGDVSAGQPYIVGEQRPEIFVPKESGKIIPSVSEFVRTAKQTGFSNSSASLISSARFAALTLSSAASANFPGLDRREYGGSVMAGMPYLAGERRAEVFMPDSSAPRGGSPNNPIHVAGAGSTHIELHIHGVSDADSFRRSQGQIHADLQQQMSIAHYRNRGGY